MRTTALLLTLFAVAGCSPAHLGATGASAAPPGTTRLRLALTGEPRSLNRIFHDTDSNLELNFLYNDPL